MRVDTGVSEGDTVPAEFDSMIAKIIAYGRTRKEALSRLQRTLAQRAVVVIEGGTSNRAFLSNLLNRPRCRAGRATTSAGSTVWRLRVSTSRGNHAEIALVQAAIEAYDSRAERGAGAVLCVGRAWPATGPKRGGPHRRTALPRATRMRSKVYRLGPAALPGTSGRRTHRRRIERLGASRSG